MAKADGDNDKQQIHNKKMIRRMGDSFQIQSGGVGVFCRFGVSFAMKMFGCTDAGLDNGRIASVAAGGGWLACAGVSCPAVYESIRNRNEFIETSFQKGNVAACNQTENLVISCCDTHLVKSRSVSSDN